MIEIRFILSKLARVQIYESDSVVHVMKLYEHYKKYVSDNDGVDIEFPGYKVDLTGEMSESNKNKTSKK